jgi:hypothetical protein
VVAVALADWGLLNLEVRVVDLMDPILFFQPQRPAQVFSMQVVSAMEAAVEIMPEEVAVVLNQLVSMRADPMQVPVVQDTSAIFLVLWLATPLEVVEVQRPIQAEPQVEQPALEEHAPQVKFHPQ